MIRLQMDTDYSSGYAVEIKHLSFRGNKCCTCMSNCTYNYFCDQNDTASSNYITMYSQVLNIYK